MANKKKGMKMSNIKSESETEKFDQWAIVEIFGHAKFAGRVTEQAIGGASFVRVDIPAIDGYPAFTKLFGASAIYSITPVSEEIACKAAKYCYSEPISVYIPEDRQLMHQGQPFRKSDDRDNEDDEDDEDDEDLF
jgi:hypothetical protein